MVTQFTPGPWIAEDEEFSENGDYTEPQVFSCADQDNPKIICSLAVRNCMEANAHLIAAAPEMYEALRGAEVMLRALLVSTPCTVSTNDSGKFRNVNSFGVLKEVQEALAKADGKQA
jgi:hypothetical protein